jgi:hypothetical protein
VGFPKRTDRGIISSDVVVVTGSGSGVDIDEKTCIVGDVVVFDRRDDLRNVNPDDGATEKLATRKNEMRYSNTSIAMTEARATDRRNAPQEERDRWKFVYSTCPKSNGSKIPVRASPTIPGNMTLVRRVKPGFPLLMS